LHDLILGAVARIARLWAVEDTMLFRIPPMDHKEMSRRTLAIVFVWGFWAFWLLAGIACLTAGQVVRYHYRYDARGQYGRYPEYNTSRLLVAIAVALITSFFPMVLHQWKYGKVNRRCLLEFVLMLIVTTAAIILSEGGIDGIHLGCFLIMAALCYSCLRLRQGGLGYLESAQESHQSDIAQESRRATAP
jgi:hypothetical protein